MLSIPTKSAAFCGLILAAVTAALTSQTAGAEQAFATKIAGDWMANDYPEKSCTLKIYSHNDKIKFEDSVAPGIRLAGSVEVGEGEADVVLRYERGYVCRYSVSARGFRDQGNAVLSFALLSEKIPEPDRQFHCIAGQLEQFR